jgi:hypothetical protein
MPGGVLGSLQARAWLGDRPEVAVEKMMVTRRVIVGGVAE